MNIDSAKKEVKAFKRIDERYNEVYKSAKSKRI